MILTTMLPARLVRGTAALALGATLFGASSAAAGTATTDPAADATDTTDVAVAVTPPTARHELPGFDSPDAAAGDLDAAVGAFAIETFVEHYDLEASLTRLGVLPINSGIPMLPSSNDWNVALNVATRHGGVVDQIGLQYFALAASQLDTTSMVRVPAEEVAAFVAGLEQSMTPAVAADGGAAVPVDPATVSEQLAEQLAGEQLAEIRARNAEVFGADEITTVAMQLTVQRPGGPQQVTMLFDAVRYGDAWWLLRIGGDGAAIVGLGVADGGIVE